MHILIVQQELALSARQTPNKDELMLRTTAGRARQSIREALWVGESKLELHTLLGKPNHLRHILYGIIYLVGDERDSFGRHGEDKTRR